MSVTAASMRLVMTTPPGPWLVGYASTPTPRSTALCNFGVNAGVNVTTRLQLARADLADLAGQAFVVLDDHELAPAGTPRRRSGGGAGLALVLRNRCVVAGPKTHTLGISKG